jgi:hypothetical protein
MRNRFTPYLVAGVALLALSAPGATTAGPPRTPGHGIVRWAPASEPFAISGRYTGALEGTIAMDGAAYPLSQNVTLYAIGVGIVPTGTWVHDQVVFMTGVMKDGTAVISTVIVRPEDEGMPPSDDGSSHVQERTGQEPQ